MVLWPTGGRAPRLCRPVLSEVFLAQVLLVSRLVNVLSFEYAQQCCGNGRKFIVGFLPGISKVSKKLAHHLRDGFAAPGGLRFGRFNKQLVHSQCNLRIHDVHYNCCCTSCQAVMFIRNFSEPFLKVTLQATHFAQPVFPISRSGLNQSRLHSPQSC